MVVGPTHTRGDTGMFVEDDAVLFSGGVVMNNSFLAANQGSSMKAWLSAFDAFEVMGPRTIVPSHGPVGDGSLIAANREVMEAVRARSRALKEQGMSLNETALIVQKELQAKYPGWPRANGQLAASNTAYHEAP